jgi:ribosomal protein S12 methylthiotransferase accessory factor YcaO
MESGMARYKHIDTSPRLLPVDLERQLLPGMQLWVPKSAMRNLIDRTLSMMN